MARAEMQVIDTQLKLARSVEGTVTGLRSLKWAAEDSGVDGLEQSLTRLNRRLGAVEMGVGPAAVTVERLGVNLKELAEVDVDERLARIADRIVESGISAQEAARHLQNLGFQQAEAVQFFMQGGDAIRGAREEIEKYGLAVSEIDARRMEEANNALARLALISDGLRTRFTVALAPTIFEIATRLQAVAEVALDAVFGLDEVDDAASHLGGNKAILTFARSAGIAIARLVDAFDGLKGAMEALESFFKRWGYGAARSLLAPFKSVASAINMVAPGLAKPLLDAYQTVDEGYKRHTKRMLDGSKRFLSAFAKGEGDAAKAFKEAWDNVEIDLSAPSARTPGTPLALGGGDIDGASAAGGAAENVAKETEAIRERLLERLGMFREMLASEQELEIFKHEQNLEQLQELWEEGIIPTEAEYMEMLEELEARHQDRLTEIKEGAERERMAIAEKATQEEINQRRAVISAAIGFLDQLAGESKAAAIASIALSIGSAISEAIPHPAVADTAALKYDPTGVMAARVAAMCTAQVGLIAATGLAQAASVSSRGTSGLQGGASGSVGGRSSAPSSGGYGGGGGGAGPRVNINLIEDRDRAGQVDVNRSDDEEVDADVFVADIRGGGPRAQALQETFNLRRTGS